MKIHFTQEHAIIVKILKQDVYFTARTETLIKFLQLTAKQKNPAYDNIDGIC